MSVAVKQSGLLRMGRRPRVWTVSFTPDAINGVREDAAIGLVAGVSLDGKAVRNDFDRVPIFQRPIFNATWDRPSQSWVRLVPKGDPAFTWSPTDPYREVVYRCRPFWYRMELESGCLPRRISVTDRPLEGYTLAPMFKNGSDFVYRPCFEMGVGADGLPHSRAGLQPYTANGIELMRVARAYDATAHTERVTDWASDLLLMLVEMATWDFDSLMRGNTATATYSCGTALRNLQASSGCMSNGRACAWRGKENPWKNVNSFLCDLAIGEGVGDRPTLWYLSDPSKFNGYINGHYRREGDFLLATDGTVEYRGFGMSKSGFPFPVSSGTNTSASVKGSVFLYQNLEALNRYAVLLAVGGASNAYVLPTGVKSSPLNLECAEASTMYAGRFGARLVLG